MAATILSPANLADELGTDARTVRKFLRSVTPKDQQPGKGSRWNIEKKNLRSLRSQFAKFQAAQNEKVAAKTETDDAPEVITVDSSPATTTS